MKNIIKYPMLFLFGGSIYYLLEIIFRGYSFPAMVVCGGLCFIICGTINEKNRCTVDCGGRNHSNRISVRIDSERVARTAYVGLQQYAGKHSWSDMPSVHSAVVLFVSTWNLLG